MQNPHSQYFSSRKFHKTRPHRKVSTRPNWLHWLISRHPPSKVLTGSAYMMKHRDLRGSLCFYTSKCIQSPIFDHILKWRTTLNALKKIYSSKFYLTISTLSYIWANHAMVSNLGIVYFCIFKVLLIKIKYKIIYIWFGRVWWKNKILE
jgi:hypothetical protein